MRDCCKIALSSTLLIDLRGGGGDAQRGWKNSAKDCVYKVTEFWEGVQTMEGRKMQDFL